MRKGNVTEIYELINGIEMVNRVLLFTLSHNEQLSLTNKKAAEVKLIKIFFT